MNYPWLSDQWQQLLKQRDCNAIHHALLLTGAEGLGKKDCAYAFAQLLLCQHSDQQPQACGHCQSCRWFNEGVHPDVFNITLEEKASTIKVDQIRQLTEKLSQTAHCGDYQVVIIHPADTLSLAAANALLKTLEEPTGKVLYLLVTHHKDRLPITIQSRCQLLSFHAGEPGASMSWLRQQIDVSEQVAAQLLRAAQGAPLLAMQLAEQGYVELQQNVVEQLSALIRRQQQPIAACTVLMKLDIPRVLDVFLFAIGDLIKLAMGVSSQYFFLSEHCLQQFPMSSKVYLPHLQAWQAACLKARALLQRHSGLNVQMALESLLIQWSAIEFNKRTSHVG